MVDGTIGVILNPAAGGGKGLRLLPKVTQALGALGERYHLQVTTARGEATELGRRFAAGGARLVIAVGGDGTVNEVVNGLLAAGEDRATTLGIVSAGRGTDFVRNLGLPTSVDAAVERAVRGSTHLVDVGRATFADGSSRLFVNAAGLGFDAAVADRAAKSHLPGSTMPYIRGVLGALVNYRNVEVEIEVDGASLTGRTCLALVANGEKLGGGMKLAPGAALDDGLLDLAIVGDIGKFDLLRNFPGIYRGRHVDHPKFSQRPARSVTVTTAKPTRVQLDGEVVGGSPVTFTVEPRALRVAR